MGDLSITLPCILDLTSSFLQHSVPFCNMLGTFVYVLFLGKFTGIGLPTSSSSAAASPEYLGRVICVNSVSTLVKRKSKTFSSSR